MKKLDGYIRTNIIGATLLVLLLIVVLYLIFSFIDELDNISTSYQVFDALYYILLTAPRKTYQVLPMACLIGCLIGLGNLANSSELTVMRAAGVSLSRILWAVAKPTLILMLFGIILGEYLSPISEAKAEAYRSLALRGEISKQIAKYGLWHKIDDEFIHINSVQLDGRLFGVARYKVNDFNQLEWVSFAKEAHYQQDYWQLLDVSYTEFSSEKIITKTIANEIWQANITPKLLNVLVLKPDVLSVNDLWYYSNYLAEQGLNNDSYRLSFWNKLLQPFITLSLVIMAVSFIFGPLRSVTLGQRIFTGVLVGFIFSIIQDLLSPASLVFGFNPLLAVITPSIVCLTCGIYLLRKAG